MSPTNELQSTETDRILTTIDDLRALGIGHILDLPQIIVCGDQSSGKSSVLNAVSNLKFPTRDGLCTRFATEVIMRPGIPENIVVSIVPGTVATPEERYALEGFRRGNVNMQKIESIIAKATAVMGIDPEDPQSKRFSDHILRFEVTGPTQPSLTLVDLPGLFQAPSKYQTREDTESVQKMVLDYMRNKRSVILAVISAKSEFVLQTVTNYARKVDPEGVRTLGIITKPDKLDEGSEMERHFFELAEGRLSPLYHGWHVLVNRDHSTRDYSQSQRDDAEKDFLSKGIWSKIPHHHKGVFTLRSRLSGALRDHILEGLPELICETEDEIKACEASLFNLGVPRATTEQRRQYLMHAAQVFSGVMRSCINGSYDDKFFNTDNKKVNRSRQLRAVIQNTLMQYSIDMQQFGHAKHIIDTSEGQGEAFHSRQIARKDFEDEVAELMKHSRGRELMGTHNPMIVRELFFAQSDPWEKLTNNYRSKIWNMAKTVIDSVLDHATDENTKRQLQKLVIKPLLNDLGKSLDQMIARLLRPRLESHPITYSQSLAADIQTIEQAYAEKIFAEKYEQAINTHGQVVAKDTLKWLFSVQLPVPPADLARFAASKAIDVMRAYYKIAKETFVDNFSTLAIEDCLVAQLPNLFSPEVVTTLDDDTIEAIAMETDSAARERSQTEERLELCNAALRKLQKLENLRAPGLRITRETEFDLNLGFEGVSLAKTSEQQVGEDLSKLDLGLSDQDEALTISDGTSEDRPNRPSSQPRKLNGYQSDGSWVQP